MLRITVSTPRPTAPQYTADAGGKMVAWYQDAIASTSEKTLFLPTPICVDIAPSVAASVVVRAVVKGLSHRPDLLVELQCATEQEHVLYRQLYNLWFARTKQERL